MKRKKKDGAIFDAVYTILPNFCKISFKVEGEREREKEVVNRLFT